MLKNISGQKLTVFAFDATTNLPKTGDAANLTAYVDKDDGGVTVLTDTSATEKDSTNAKGYYIFDLSQAETNANKLLFTCKSSTSDVVVICRPDVIYTAPANFQATSIDSNGRVDVIKVAGTTQTARDIGGAVPNAAPGASGGLLIAGSNAATTFATLTSTGAFSAGSIAVSGAAVITGGLTTNITGNLSGSVGSVTGAVGSVTGAVGSVTGNVGGSVASVVGNVGGNVTGSVGSVAGNVTGNVNGSVASVVGNVGGSVASVTGAVGSVTGNVGGSVASVVGNVGGNVAGSVGSVAAGGITSSSFGAGAINANAVATDAFGALEISDAAVTKIQTGLATAVGLSNAVQTLQGDLSTLETSIISHGDEEWTGEGGGGSSGDEELIIEETDVTINEDDS